MPGFLWFFKCAEIINCDDSNLTNKILLTHATVIYILLDTFWLVIGSSLPKPERARDLLRCPPALFVSRPLTVCPALFTGRWILWISSSVSFLWVHAEVGYYHWFHSLDTVEGSKILQLLPRHLLSSGCWGSSCFCVLRIRLGTLTHEKHCHVQ